MMGASTSLRCAGCCASRSTGAVRPEDWPKGWFTDGVFVWHSERCQRNARTRLEAHRCLVTSADQIEPGSRGRLLELSRAILKESASSRGTKCDLARLVIRLFDPMKV